MSIPILLSQQISTPCGQSLMCQLASLPVVCLFWSMFTWNITLMIILHNVSTFSGQCFIDLLLVDLVIRNQWSIIGNCSVISDQLFITLASDQKEGLESAEERISQMKLFKVWANKWGGKVPIGLSTFDRVGLLYEAKNTTFSNGC